MRRVSAPTVLIMAAGQGTRMKSAVPKVLHPVCGRALVAWPIAAAKEAGAGRIGVIVSPDRDISGALPDGVEAIPQPEANGTGGRPARGGRGRRRVGDRRRPQRRRAAGLGGADRRPARDPRRAAAPRPPSSPPILDDAGTYGRVVRSADGTEVERIVETKGGAGDATAEELEIREINSGIYAFDGARRGGRAAGPLQRQRPGRVLPARRAAAAEGGGRARRRPRLRRPERDPRRQLARRPGAWSRPRPAARSSSATCSPG